MGSVALTVCERGYLDRFEKTLDMLADSNFENVLDYNISALLRSVEAMVSDVNVVKAIVRESNGTVLASCEHPGPDNGKVTLRRLISKAGVVVGIVELDIREKPAYGWLGLEGIIILVLLVLLGAVGFVLLAFLRRNGMSLWGSFMNRAEASSRGAGGQWTISPAMEEKLKTIIAYIEANYRREISREGLAVMVGVNADNLGRYFKLYAGKRIGDYINDLRIGAAISMLVESDQTISTIAASVGFDCIGTFNRVFKSAMGMSPVEYRMCKGRRRREGFSHFLISIYRRMRNLVYQ